MLQDAKRPGSDGSRALVLTADSSVAQKGEILCKFRRRNFQVGQDAYEIYVEDSAATSKCGKATLFWVGMNTSTSDLRRVAVYCASAMGNDPAYRAEAEALGRAVAAAGLGLVYGGANSGLMGTVADAALAGGTEVIGVLPAVLSDREIAHAGITRVELVGSMHERKARMVELADAFLILPGGYGTLDELMEVVTWAQLKIHAKPCILINTLNYWDGLLQFLDSAVREGFLKPQYRGLLQMAANAEAAVQSALGHIIQQSNL